MRDGVELPCPHKTVGTDGCIIGVDLSEVLLEKAREQAARPGWQNAELIRLTVLTFRVPLFRLCRYSPSGTPLDVPPP